MKNLLQFLTRYSNFLIFLILEVVAFILITTSQHYQGSAVWSSANQVMAGIQRMNTSVEEYFQLRKDNQLLAEENAQLKTQLALLSNAEERKIERDSQYIYTHLDWEYIPAKVIGMTSTQQHNYLTINKGWRDSIKVDMGVVCHDGVVGIVSSVGEKYSLVVPLIHTEMHLSCRLKNNGYVGRTEWMGVNPHKIQLKDISRHITVSEGDTVVTSGLTQVFPEGILVGVVEDNELKESDNYHLIELQLNTDYNQVKYVQVIYNQSLKIDEQ